jgi:hypothetical protein
MPVLKELGNPCCQFGEPPHFKIYNWVSTNISVPFPIFRKCKQKSGMYVYSVAKKCLTIYIFFYFPIKQGISEYFWGTSDSLRKSEIKIVALGKLGCPFIIYSVKISYMVLNFFLQYASNWLKLSKYLYGFFYNLLLHKMKLN